MKPKKTNNSQSRLFESRLSDILSPHNNLLLLGEFIDWEGLEEDLSQSFDSEDGAPAKPVRLVAGLLMLQHMSGFSDEHVVRAWQENPYWQHFCGFEYFQWKCPIDPSSLTRWRQRIGEAGLQRILTETLKVALTTETITHTSLESVTVDTTVMPKNIAYPTDARLYHRALTTLVREAKKRNIRLRQTYTFLSKRAYRKACQYAHARQMKRARREIKRLHTYLGRVHRDIARNIERDELLKEELNPLLILTQKTLEQKREDQNKIYSIHEPAVECIAKGKAHKKYEFGCKASLVLTHKEGFALLGKAHHGKPYDGHTLKGCLQQAEELTGKTIKRGFVDKGYRGHKIQGKEIYISGQRGLSKHYKKLLRRRQAIEPHIGHMKSEGKLGRNYLKGVEGDIFNAILCAIGHNIRMILRKLEPLST